jgi:hypothetical protein
MNKKQDKLTVKQKLYVKNYTDASNPKTFLKTIDSFQAMTGKKNHYSRVGGYLMNRKPHVKAAIIEALHRVKITPQYQAKKLKDLMEATRPIYHEGLKVDTIEDNEIRHKALVTSLKITDAIENLESQMNQGIQINIAPEMAERLVKIAAEMKAMREAHSNQPIPLIHVKESHGLS